MSRSLLDITQDLEALDDLLSEASGDITGCEATVDAWLAELSQDLSGKVDNYCALITHMKKRSQARAEEAERLAKRAKIDERNADFLRARLQMALENLGINKLDTPRFQVGIVRNGGSAPLLIHDEKLIPAEFMRVIPEQHLPDKFKLRDAIEKGQQIPGVSMGPKGNRLSIR